MVPLLMKVVEPLLITVKSNQPDKGSYKGNWIGALLFHLHIDELAQKTAEQSKVEPYERDIGGCPRIHHLGHGPLLGATSA
jgi:hypothetical protein